LGGYFLPGRRAPSLTFFPPPSPILALTIFFFLFFGVNRHLVSVFKVFPLFLCPAVFMGDRTGCPPLFFTKLLRVYPLSSHIPPFSFLPPFDPGAFALIHRSPFPPPLSSVTRRETFPLPPRTRLPLPWKPFHFFRWSGECQSVFSSPQDQNQNFLRL